MLPVLFLTVVLLVVFIVLVIFKVYGIFCKRIPIYIVLYTIFSAILVMVNVRARFCDFNVEFETEYLGQYFNI